MTTTTPTPACACCGAGLTTTGVVAYACSCSRDQWGWGLVLCLSCLKCQAHCDCPEGPCGSWNEVSRRAVAGTLAHQRARAAE